MCALLSLRLYYFLSLFVPERIKLQKLPSQPPFPFCPPLWDRLTQCMRCSMHIRIVHVYVSWFSEAGTRPRNQKVAWLHKNVRVGSGKPAGMWHDARASGAGTEQKMSQGGKRKKGD